MSILIYHVREITKEQYERAMQHSGYISKEDESAIFTTAEIWGYGVYSTKVKEENGKYYVHYELGSSCD